MSKTDSGNSNSKKNELSWGYLIFKRVAVILLVLLLDANDERKCFQNDEQVNGNGEYTAKVEITIQKLLELIKKNNDNINKKINFTDKEKNENGGIKFFTETRNKKELSRYIQRMIKINIFENLSDVDNFQGQKKWNLRLKLDSNNKNIDESIKCLCNLWNKSKQHLHSSPKIEIEQILCQSSQERPKTPPKNKPNEPNKIQDIAKILRKLDCDKQTEIIKKNKGIFFLKAPEKIHNWLLWRLGIHIKGFETGEKIIIKLRNGKRRVFSVNDILSEIAESMKIPNYSVKRKTVIQGLADLVKTKNVVIIIYHCDTLRDDSQLVEDLFKLCDDLNNEILGKNERLNFFIFFVVEKLIDDCDFHRVELDEIPEEDAVNWLNEQENLDRTNSYNWEEGRDKISNYSKSPNKNPYYLIDDICKAVFNVDIAEVEHYWKNIA
ncbi:MAG: hypothetical protein WBF90_34945 [Rivularia sp. (in: cyanobacteria)]